MVVPQKTKKKVEVDGYEIGELSQVTNRWNNFNANEETVAPNCLVETYIDITMNHPFLERQIQVVDELPLGWKERRNRHNGEPYTQENQPA